MSLRCLWLQRGEMLRKYEAAVAGIQASTQAKLRGVRSKLVDAQPHVM